MRRLSPLIERLFSRENRYALVLCVVAIALIVMTTDSTPQWIYQGF